MPFIKQWRRYAIETQGFAGLAEVEPGDRCYVFYKKLVDEWRKEPRWSTVHRLVKEHWYQVETDDDDQIALQLAWDVFWAIHVLPYEEQKRKENGDI